MLVSSLAVLLGLYAAGTARAWRTVGYGRSIRPLEALAFACAWLALAGALLPPLDELSEEWLWAHMVQHELLMVVAAPLAAMSAPLLAAVWALPPRWRRRTIDAVRRRSLAAAWSLVTSPLSGFLLYGAALWIWHLPSLYDAALAHESVHVLQHACFFATAALFWWSIAHGRFGRSGYGAAVLYVFATAIHGAVLGALFTFSPHAWYTPYAADHHAGLSPLEDQQLAGLLMWVPAGFVFIAGGLSLFAGWLRQSDRLSRFKPLPLKPTQIP